MLRLQGNLNWVASREHELSHPVWKGREEELTPLCNAAESDSANLDHMAEVLVSHTWVTPWKLFTRVRVRGALAGAHGLTRRGCGEGQL